MPRSISAFTLFELLVVVTIIAILTSLLFPAIGLVHTQAQKVACISNLRQVGLAFISYAGDSDGFLPNTYTYNDTQPTSQFNDFLPLDYVWPLFHNRAWCCTSKKVNTRSDIGKPYSYAYFMNWNLDGDPSGGQHTWSTVPQVASVTAAFLGRVRHLDEALLAADLSSGGRGGYHGGQANMAMADGSARSRPDDSWRNGVIMMQLDPGPTVANEYILPNFNAVSPRFGVKGFAY